MIEEKDILSLNYYRYNQPFSGSFQGMRYRIIRVPDQKDEDGNVTEPEMLEAVIWTLLHTKNFATAVMTAVNLGNNTNTLGAVTGSLAALLYGQQSIPERWLKALRGREQLERICQDFELHF